MEKGKEPPRSTNGKIEQHVVEGTSRPEVNVESYLQRDFAQLLTSLGIGHEDLKRIWSVLCARYQESHRHYHTLSHIYELVLLADRYETLIHDLSLVRLSVYFHDIVYDVPAAQNEHLSALLFRELLGAKLSDDLVNRVVVFIECTLSHDVSAVNGFADVQWDSEQLEDLQLFLDLDMMILAADREIYEEYITNIRKEFSMYSDFTYAFGRYRVLQSFITKDGHPREIYRSKNLSTLNAKARENIGWELNCIQQDFYSQVTHCCVS